MTTVPEQFSARVFTDYITDAEYVQLSRDDKIHYDRYWFGRNDRLNQDAFAKREAMAEAREEGRREERTRIIIGLAASGMSVKQIAALPGLSLEKVRAALLT